MTSAWAGAHGELAGAIIFALGHGPVKSSHFRYAGIMPHRFETVDETPLRVRGRRQPGKLNLTRLHGEFAAGAKLKPWVHPGQPEPEAKAAGAEKGAMEHPSNWPPRLTWAG